MAFAQDLPFDLIQPILEHLTDRTDWNSCCLVSKSFNKVAIPLLYQTLDSRIITQSKSRNSHIDSNNSNPILYHPATTLLSRPSLANHVRHVTETGAVHRAILPRYATITDDALKALALCTNLRSFTWMDDTMYGPGTGSLVLAGSGNIATKAPGVFLTRFVDIVRGNPIGGHSPLSLRSLTIRTHFDLGSSVWDSLNTLSGLTRVSVWSMDGPPRVLQGGWSLALGSTLEELELGRCAGVPPTILVTVISHLPLLRSLRLKGVASNSILDLLTYLPLLDNLDVEYLPSRTRLHPRDQARLFMLPSLKTLTVRSNSRIDAFDPLKLYDWIRLLASNEGLQAFKLHAFSLSLPPTSPAPSFSAPKSYLFIPNASSYKTFSFRDLGQTLVPRGFILDLARLHSASLRRWEAAEGGVMMISDVECLCVSFPQLKVLDCAVGLEDVDSIYHAIRSAHNLTTLKLHIHWLPSSSTVKWRSPHFADVASRKHPSLDVDWNEDEDEDEDVSSHGNSLDIRDSNRNLNLLHRSSNNTDGYSTTRRFHEGPSNVQPRPGQNGKFTAADARSLMLHTEKSLLRTIGVGGILYQGLWVVSNHEDVEFVVTSNVKDT
ncbi:hypothetical protein DFH05DRAFT_1520130 [Lentinula detonsa]|uniref:F-box domain-containing protein n=1 Tax=Lentinula detonsa TaxID=2804962 RepID=A0A9W8P7Q2_9AGAR|nr:hypothetical protein DFH05DRAFT_1520130 [Lentinula detonsa]KAJ3980793.1 hypothetical protein F5890DRAFT_641363 [Lentinula detonsa]